MLDCFYWVTTIVGYTTQDAAGKKYNALGACFANTGIDGKFKLADIQANNWDYESDQLRVINPANSSILKGLVWLTKEEAVDGEVGDKAGWYDDTEFTYEGETEFDIGSGFKTSLGSKNVSFTYSGQVYDQAFTIDCKNKKYVIIPNALPRVATLSEISATGWDYESDQLRILNPANSSVAQGLVWLTKDEAIDGEVGDKAGWYDDTEFTYEGGKTIDPGAGFQTSLGSKNVMISFPAALTPAE